LGLRNPLILLGALQRKLKPTTEDYLDNLQLIAWATLSNIKFTIKITQLLFPYDSAHSLS
jgi:hypothetical protein